jgi:hypothetical protein
MLEEGFVLQKNEDRAFARSRCNRGAIVARRENTSFLKPCKTGKTELRWKLMLGRSHTHQKMPVRIESRGEHLRGARLYQ